MQQIKPKCRRKKKTLAWFVSRHPGTIRMSWLRFWISVTGPEQSVLTFWCIVRDWSRYFRLLWISDEHSRDTIILKSHLKYVSTRCRNLVQMSPNSADWRTASEIIKFSPSLKPNCSPSYCALHKPSLSWSWGLISGWYEPSLITEGHPRDWLIGIIHFYEQGGNITAQNLLTWFISAPVIITCC